MKTRKTKDSWAFVSTLLAMKHAKRLEQKAKARRKDAQRRAN